MIRYLEQGLLE